VPPKRNVTSPKRNEQSARSRHASNKQSEKPREAKTRDFRRREPQGHRRRCRSQHSSL
jgi:hypothetical protein